MFRVIACITEQHDFWLVGAAALVCVFSWVGALFVLDRVEAAGRRRRHAWLLLAAATAGGGAWATHFVAMLAFSPGLAIGFSLAPTLLSAAIAVAGAWAAFEAHRSFQGAGGAIAAGVALAAGVVGLHFVGMAGVRAAAQQVWAIDLVVASLLAVAALAIAGFAMLSRIQWRHSKIAACALFVGGVVCLHFVAMGALTLVPDPRMAAPGDVLDRAGLGVMVTFGAAVLVMLTAMAAFADRRIVEERLLRAEEADRSKSRFIANMSHELRTPLNAIIGYSELIVETSLEEMTVADAERVRLSASHLLALVNDLLDLAKIEANRLVMRPTPCRVEDLIESVCDSLRGAAAAQRVNIVVEAGEHIPDVFGDPLRIKQCLLNLMSNAVKFTEDGVIRVSARGVNGAVKVTVSDTGIGMTAEQVSRLFRPFVQADASIAHTYGGTGLGLSITKRLMELMDGDVSVVSAPGQGSTFTLTLPICATRATSALPPLIESAAA